MSRRIAIILSMELLIEADTRAQLKNLARAKAGSYIFYGPESVGKFTAAMGLTTAICGDEYITNRILIEPHKTTIGIATIIAISRTLSLKPGSVHQNRLIIIDQAEKLTREAQNAFLKTLEEPPIDVTILLITSRLDRLLPTIISRCHKIYFPRLDTGKIEEYLAARGQSEGVMAKTNADLSFGAVGKAIQLGSDRTQLEKSSTQINLARQFISSPLFIRLAMINRFLNDFDPGSMLQAIIQLLQAKLRPDSPQSRQAARLIIYGESLKEYLAANGNPKFAFDVLAMELDR